MKLNKEEQEALNAWLTLRQDLVEGKPVNLKLMARKDELMRKLDKESPVFTHINNNNISRPQSPPWTVQYHSKHSYPA